VSRHNAALQCAASASFLHLAALEWHATLGLVQLKQQSLEHGVTQGFALLSLL
jgi:hypothetical protein